MRKLMLGVLGAIAITIAGQGTTFAAQYDMTVVTTHQTLSSSSITPIITTGDTNGSNQNHSQDQNNSQGGD